VGIVTTLAVAVAAKLIADELKASAPSVTQRALKTAVSILPQDLRVRLSEEWAADVQSYRGEFAQSLRAVGLCWAAVQIQFASKTLARYRSTEPVLAPTSTKTRPARTLLEHMGREIAEECTDSERAACRGILGKPP